MTRFTKFGFAVAVTLVMSAPFVARADDKDVIDYRQHIMKTLGEQAASLGMIMQMKAPPTNFAAHAQVLADTAAMALVAFEPKVTGGEAKPDVWAKYDDFSKRMKELAANTADFAKTAKAGGMAAAGPKMKDTLTCKGCHDLYREQKK